MDRDGFWKTDSLLQRQEHLPQEDVGAELQGGEMPAEFYSAEAFDLVSPLLAATEGGATGSGLPRDEHGREIPSHAQNQPTAEAEGPWATTPRSQRRLEKKQMPLIEHRIVLGPEPRLEHEEDVVSEAEVPDEYHPAWGCPQHQAGR